MLLHFSLFDEPGFRLWAFFSIEPTLIWSSTGLSLRFQTRVPIPVTCVWSRHPLKHLIRDISPNLGISWSDDGDGFKCLLTLDFETGILVWYKLNWARFNQLLLNETYTPWLPDSFLYSNLDDEVVIIRLWVIKCLTNRPCFCFLLVCGNRYLFEVRESCTQNTTLFYDET